MKSVRGRDGGEMRPRHSAPVTGRQHQLAGVSRSPRASRLRGPIHLGRSAARPPCPGGESAREEEREEGDSVLPPPLSLRIRRGLRLQPPGPPPVPSPPLPAGMVRSDPSGPASVDVARIHAEEERDAGSLR